MSILVDFQAIRSEVRSMRDTLQGRNCVSEFALVRSSCQVNDYFPVHSSLGRKNANHRLKDLSLSQNASFVK